jgi:hypothetical protein
MGGIIINLYEKLNNVKIALANSKLKKSGYNPFAKFHYSTLQDILPDLVKENHKNKIFMEFRITENEGKLKLIDIEDTDNFLVYHMRLHNLEKITFKGQNDLQVLGSKISYLKRYLITSAYDISTEEDIDSMPMPNTVKKPIKRFNKESNIIKKVKI